MATVTPVALVVFNRPEHTAASFARIRRQRPDRLFIIADGPRPDHPGDRERCEEVRAAVSDVDWPCEVHRDYAEENLGLKRRVSSGLNWVFSQADRAIILEDDCVAEPDFFRFCDALLERYADDHRVAAITGDNFQRGHLRGDASYYFSKYPHVWGWATWRRAWELYDGDIGFWPAWRSSPDWRRRMPGRIERRYWEQIFERVARGETDSWAYPWTASIWHAGGLTATPNTNLVRNIGFGADATNTQTDPTDGEVGAIGELTHPAAVAQDRRADRYAFRHHFGGGPRLIPRRLVTRLRRLREARHAPEG